MHCDVAAVMGSGTSVELPLVVFVAVNAAAAILAAECLFPVLVLKLALPRTVGEALVAACSKASNAAHQAMHVRSCKFSMHSLVPVSPERYIMNDQSNRCRCTNKSVIARTDNHQTTGQVLNESMNGWMNASGPASIEQSCEARLPGSTTLSTACSQERAQLLQGRPLPALVWGLKSPSPQGCSSRRFAA